jgi:mono/diheme cytochrome c family protein
MIMKMKKIILPLLLSMILLASCNKDKNHPGYVYFPDMYYSPAYKSYSSNPVFADSMTMRIPVEGTVPRGYMPYPYQPKSFEDQQAAGLELMNPIEMNEQVLAEGKRQYDIYCKICHGEFGNGDGHLYASGLFIAKPTSLIEDYVQSKPDGEIYHVITVGSLSGLMGPHGGQIIPDKRWKIIHYVRALAEI